MKIMLSAAVSLSLLTFPTLADSQTSEARRVPMPMPSERTVALAECIAFTVSSQDGQAKDMSEERKGQIIALAEPFNFEADLDGLDDNLRQTLVVNKLRQQYALKEREGTQALVNLHKEKCDSELNEIEKGSQ